MSVENFKYRTSSLFLRNEFDSDEKWAMPKIPKSDFSDLTADILYINYELSSWQHYGDDSEKCYIKTTGNMKKYFIHKIFKGTGSAFGGEWKPKKEDDERFLGKPGEIKRIQCGKKHGGYIIDTKIGEDGRAVMERHYSDHFNPKLHSPIHDHLIDWSYGYPKHLSQINYFDSNIPEFKSYKGAKTMSDNNITYIEDHRTVEERLEDNRFKTLDEFKWSIETGGDMEIEYNNKVYFICKIFDNEQTRYSIYQIYIENVEETMITYDTVNKLLDHELDGHKLREIATELIVWERVI